MLRKALLAIVIIATLAAISIPIASASSTQQTTVNAAFVVNHGLQPGDNCSVAFINGATYYGYMTHLVVTSSGLFNLGCLVFGLPINTTFVGSGNNKVQVNSAGVGVLSYNGNH